MINWPNSLEVTWASLIVWLAFVSVVMLKGVDPHDTSFGIVLALVSPSMLIPLFNFDLMRKTLSASQSARNLVLVAFLATCVVIGLWKLKVVVIAYVFIVGACFFQLWLLRTLALRHFVLEGKYPRQIMSGSVSFNRIQAKTTTLRNRLYAIALIFGGCGQLMGIIHVIR